MPGPGRKPTISDDEILETFHEFPDPVMTTQEVAGEIELGRRGTYNRLSQLADDGQLETKKIGKKATVWWSPEALQSRYGEK